MNKAEPNKIYPDIQHPDGTQRNAYDADALQLYGKPYNLLNPDEKAAAKAACKNPPRSIELYSNQQTKAPAPPKIDLNLRPDVQAAKDAYLESLTAKQRDEAAKLEAGRNKTALRHKIADLERKIVSGRIEAGLEKAAALKELYTLKQQL
jgi:hypothetical protein